MNVLTLVIVIVLTATLAKMYKIPQWIFVIPVTFYLYTILRMDNIFFSNEEKGIVDRGLNSLDIN